MRCAGCAFNDWADMRYDAHVKRTASRPLRARRDRAVGGAGRRRGFALGGFFLVLLVDQSRDRAATPLPRWPSPSRIRSSSASSPLPQAFLGIAFSFGIPMAFAAVLGYVSPFGWWLMRHQPVLGVAYDTEYAMVDRDDDIRIGMRTSAITFGRLRRAGGGRLLWPVLRGHGWVGVRLSFGALVLDRVRDRCR